VYAPVNLSVVFCLVTVPDNGSGVLGYDPRLHLSEAGHLVQFSAPPDNLFAIFVLSQNRGAFDVSFSFSLAPLAHLVLIGDMAGTPTAGQVFISGAVSGHISYAETFCRFILTDVFPSTSSSSNCFSC
jgi:hypothetical protein